MGTPHYWTTVGKFFNRPLLVERVSDKIRNRIKYMMGYKEVTLETIQQENAGHEDDDSYDILLELDHYGLGAVRSREEYLKFAEIDLEKKKCGPMTWCSEGERE
jgi:hypothetical protein